MKNTLVSLFSIIVLVLGIQLSPQPVQALTTNLEAVPTHPINWSTSFAEFKATDFTIMANGRRFIGSDNVVVHSDPPDANDPNYTTLEMIWTENDVEMRLFMYFRKNSLGVWNLFEMRTYNGNQNGDWIYYYRLPVMGLSGRAFESTAQVFSSQNGGQGEVRCRNCYVRAFSPETDPQYQLVTDFELPQVITIPLSPTSGYAINMLLKNGQDTLITDQTGVNYTWSVENNTILNIYPDTLTNSDGSCFYNILNPCPNFRVSMSGRTLGRTRVNVVAQYGTIELASRTMNVEIVPNNTVVTTATPRPTTSPTPITLPTPQATPSVTTTTPQPTPVVTPDTQQQIQQLNQQVANLNKKVESQGNLLNKIVAMLRKLFNLQ